MLKCWSSGLEEYGSDKSKCQEHFDVYKECKKKEVFHFLFPFIVYIPFVCKWL